jgi:hypothetical protein
MLVTGAEPIDLGAAILAPIVGGVVTLIQHDPHRFTAGAA